MNTNKLKVLSLVTRFLTAFSALAVVVLYIFDFAKIQNHYSMSGFEMAFGASKTSETLGKTVNTWVSAWYAMAIILSLLTLVAAVYMVVRIFKKKIAKVGSKAKGSASKYVLFGFSAASAINLTVLFVAFPGFFDVNPLFSFTTAAGHTLLSPSQVSTTVFFLIAFIASLLTFVVATANMLVVDKLEVVESNGAKLAIPARIVHFLKDYKRELKNITWSTKKMVIRNTIVVLVVCALVGAFIWALDYGLVNLLDLLMGLKSK